MTRAFVILCLLLSVSAAHAAEPTDYAGRFELADPAAAQATVDGAIEEAAEQFPKLFRGLARNKLKDAAQVVQWFEFQPEAGTMNIRSDLNLEGWTTDLKGTPVNVRGVKGPVELRRWMEDGALRAVGAADSGEGRYVFTLSADGSTLTLGTTTVLDRLDGPMTYDVVYVRK